MHKNTEGEIEDNEKPVQTTLTFSGNFVAVIARNRGPKRSTAVAATNGRAVELA